MQKAVADRAQCLSPRAGTGQALPTDEALRDASGRVRPSAPYPPQTLAPAKPMASSTPAEAHGLDQARSLVRHFASSTLSSGVVVTEPIEQKAGPFAYFCLRGGEANAFVKVALGAPKAEGWKEPAWARWAAESGFGPEVLPYAGMGLFAQLLATRWVDGGHLDVAKVRQPQVMRDAMCAMRQLHGAAPPVHLVEPQPPGPPDYAGAVFGRLDNLARDGREEPLATATMRRYVRAALEQLQATSPRQTLCHRDTHPRNMFHDGARALFVDWDWSGWDDPMRDPGRFFVLGYVPVAEHAACLQIYFGRPATDVEQQRLRQLVLCTEVEFYASLRAKLDADNPSVALRAQRIGQLAAALSFDTP